MSQLKLYLLGTPSIELNEKPVETDRRKAIALLAFLAVSGVPHNRDFLAAMFWPESDQSSGYAYLRRTIWELNNSLGQGWLITDREVVSFNPKSDYWLDANDFQSLVQDCLGQHSNLDCLESLTQAAVLYRGDFMAGFSLKDSPDFDEWQYYQTAEFRRLLGSTLGTLSKGYGKQGEFESAFIYAHRWLALDPIDEAAHRQLMRLYAQKGQRSAAKKQYDSCVQTLEEELGVPPQPETVALFEQIKAGERWEKVPAETITSHQHTRPPRHNLPAQPTPFVGRQTELAEINRLITQIEFRLLTLVGPGGSGKTRLSIQSAMNLSQKANGLFTDGIFFVPLALLSNSESIITAIAKAINFSFYNEEERPRQQLLEYLRQKMLFLIIDNFEHLIDSESIQLIVDILKTAPGVKILATSRTRLNIQGEQIFGITGMKTPKIETVQSWQDYAVEAAPYSAIQLFQQSARRIQPDFQINRNNILAISRICLLVEGLPLGIELATGWLELLTLDEIATEIERSLDFLETELSDIPERQRSIRAIFESSWKLLNEAERIAFQQLTVFRGGFTREAAQYVTGASLKTLLGMVNKSWLQRDENGRYQAHELLRQYGIERLQSDHESWMEAKDRYSDYFVSLTYESGEKMKGAGQKEAFKIIADEFENIRSVAVWLVEQKQFETIINKLFFALYYFSLVKGYGDELLTLVKAGQQAMSVEKSDSFNQVFATILKTTQYYYTSWFWRQSDKDEIEKTWGLLNSSDETRKIDFWYIILLNIYAWVVDHEQGLAKILQTISNLRNQDDPWLIAYALLAAGELQLHTPNRKNAEIMLMEAIMLFQELGDDFYKGLALKQLSNVYWKEAAYKNAKTQLYEAIEIFSNLGSPSLIGDMENSLGNICLQEGTHDEAFHHLQEERRIYEDMGNRRLLGLNLHWTSLIAVRFNELDYARDLRVRSLQIAEELAQEDPVGLGWNYWEMGEIYRVERDFERARLWYAKARGLFDKDQNYHGLSYFHRGIGDSSLAHSNYTDALQHFSKFHELASINNHLWGVAYALTGMGRAELGLKNYQAAHDNFSESLRVAINEGNRDLCMLPLTGFAQWFLKTGKIEEAVELAAFVENHFLSWRETKSQAYQVLQKAMKKLSPEIALNARKKGNAKGFETVISIFLKSN